MADMSPRQLVGELFSTCHIPGSAYPEDGEILEAFDFSGVYENDALYDAVAGLAGRAMMTCSTEVDLIMPVTSDVNRLGTRLAGSMGIDCLPADVTGRTTDPADFRHIALLGGILHSLKPAHQMLDNPVIAERAVALVGVWDRGNPANRVALPAGVMLRSAVNRPYADYAWRPVITTHYAA